MAKMNEYKSGGKNGKQSIENSNCHVCDPDSDQYYIVLVVHEKAQC
jgi:hypothetical protein